MPADAEMDLDCVNKQDRRDLRAAMAVYAKQYRRAAEEMYGDTTILITALGLDGRKYYR